MDKMEIFKDYVDLECHRAIYEYIAEADFKSWYECAKDDGYDGYLLALADKYGIEEDYHDWEQDDIRDEIYRLEDILWKKLKNMALGEL